MRLKILSRKQIGQGMTEYIIIVALISVAAISVYQLFGATIRQQMAGISANVAGNAGTAEITAAQAAATNAAAQANENRSLGTYGGQAAAGAQ